jgi:CheY-like chemotaxis protein
MDMRMPVMDGYEATKRIKATPTKPSPVIIALTASAFEEERAVALSVGCNDFTLKPFREAEIFEKIKEHLGVDYIYEASEEDTSATSAEETLPEEVVMSASTLPGDLIANLQVATIQGRFNQMLGLIEEIRAHNPAFANKLANLVNNYAYDDVLQLLQTK